MPDVFLDPRLPDYFDEVDINSPAEVPRVLDGFLGSRIVMLRGVSLKDVDIDLLHQVSFPQTWEMKKFQFRHFVQEYKKHRENAALYDQILLACGSDRNRVKRFVGQLDILGQIVQGLLDRMFPNINFGDVGYVARFSETRMENLHFDIDADSDTHDAVRLYINVDSAPRIWATSYQLNGLADRVAGRIDAARFRDLPSEQFVKHIGTRAFGGWHNRADERTAPRHMAYFEPGDIWVVDGRTLAHQVLFGQRVISVYARAPYEKNPGLVSTYRDKVRAAIETAASEPSSGVEPIPIKGKVVGAGDLKANWAETFGKVQSGHVRRFTGAGQVDDTAL